MQLTALFRTWNIKLQKNPTCKNLGRYHPLCFPVNSLCKTEYPAPGIHLKFWSLLQYSIKGTILLHVTYSMVLAFPSKKCAKRLLAIQLWLKLFRNHNPTFYQYQMSLIRENEDAPLLNKQTLYLCKVQCIVTELRAFSP